MFFENLLNPSWWVLDFTLSLDEDEKVTSNGFQMCWVKWVLKGEGGGMRSKKGRWTWLTIGSGMVTKNLMEFDASGICLG